MDAKDLLLKQMREAFDGDEEMSLKVALRGVTDQQAGWKANEETPTIEEIVHHLAWCKVWYGKQAFGPADIPDDVPTGDLARTLDWLDRSHAHLTACLDAISPDDLSKPVPTKFHGESAAHLFWILLMHDLVHGAQIDMVRRQWRGRGGPG